MFIEYLFVNEFVKRISMASYLKSEIVYSKTLQLEKLNWNLGVILRSLKLRDKDNFV